MPETVRVAIPGARDLIAQGLRHFVGPAAKWLPEYEAVAAWLTENRGRGLLAMGNCGRGKTLVVGRIVPLLIHHYARRIVACYDVQAMNADPDGVRRKHLLYLDDIGTEDLSVRYGERRMVFPRNRGRGREAGQAAARHDEPQPHRAARQVWRAHPRPPARHYDGRGVQGGKP